MAMVLFVIRESYGWNKKTTRTMEPISMSKKTKIPISSVKLAISILVESNILSRTDNGGWALNKDYEAWIPVRKRMKRGASPLAAENSPLAAENSPLAAENSPLAAYKEKVHTEIQGKKTAVAREAQPRKMNTVSQIVELYKFLKKIGYTEILGRFERIEQVHYAWDQANYKIYLRSAKKLLNTFGGDLAAAKVYLTARADEWDEKGLDSWELHGIARDAVNFKAKEETKDAQADEGRALQLRGVVGDSVPGALVAPGGRRPDGGEGSHRRFTPARELAGRALEGLQPQDD